MNFIPEWAPHVHPLLVHFPIALLVAAAGLDLIALLLKRDSRPRFAAVLLYVLGTLGALASFFTGRDAGDSVLLAAEANAILTEHADWALRLVWFFGVYSIIRMVEFWTNKTARLGIWWPLFAIGVGGLLVLFETAEHGAQLVYQQGVGVVAMEEAGASEALVLSTSDSLSLAGYFADAGSDSWTWKPTSPSYWADSLNWVTGSSASLSASVIPSRDRGDVLKLEVVDEPFLFTLPGAAQNVQIDLALNMDDFEGSVSIVHNFQDGTNYLFTRIAGGVMQQGRLLGGEVELMDEQPYAPSEWQQLRVVSDGTHFRAYAGTRVVTHGHGEAPASGVIGLQVEGNGYLLIDYLRAEKIPE